MKNGLLIALVLSAAGISGAESISAVYGDRFAKNTPKAYLNNIGKDVVCEPDGAGGNALVSGMSLVLKEVAVKPRTKYRLSFKGSKKGGADFASEFSDTLSLYNYRGKGYPVLRLRFFDSNGKQLPHDNTAGAIYTDSPEQYEFLFYTPSGTAGFSAAFDVPRNIAVRLSDLRFAEETGEKTLNVNGDFRLGLYNYSGITGANDKALRLVRSPEGKTGFFTGFYAHTTRFPIEPGKKYRLEYAGFGHYKGRVESFLLFWEDAHGNPRKPLLNTTLPRLFPKKYRAVYEFTAPEKAFWASLWIYHATMTEIKATEVNP